MTMKLIILLSVFMLVFLAGCQPAKTEVTAEPAVPGVISGVIRFPTNSQQPFPPTTLRLMNTEMDQSDPKAVIGEIHTDDQGQYSFPGLQPGKYSIGARTEIPGGADCETPGMLKTENWLIVTTYNTGAQGEQISTLQAVYDAPIVLQPGENLVYNLELPIKCLH